MGQSGCGSAPGYINWHRQHSAGRDKGQEPQLNCSNQDPGPNPALKLPPTFFLTVSKMFNTSWSALCYQRANLEHKQLNAQHGRSMCFGPWRDTWGEISPAELCTCASGLKDPWWHSWDQRVDLTQGRAVVRLKSYQLSFSALELI